MKVCLLTPEFLPVWGGVGTYAYNAARALRDRAEVHVFAGAVPARHEDYDLEGIQIHPAFPTGESRDVASALRFQLAAFRRLPRLAREHGFDIVHTNHAYMSDILVRLRRRRSQTVVTVHTTLDSQAGGTLQATRGYRRGLEGRIARWRLFLRPVERHYLRRTPAMIFVSRWIRDRTLQRYHVAPRVNAVVPNAIDFRRFSEASSGPSRPRETDQPTILFAGRLLALKGLDTLIRALPSLNDRIRLLLAGPGDQGPWRALADSLGIARSRYEFLGRVPYSEMADLYRAVDAVVLPSYTESYPIVALEAMASSTPLIAANAGGIPEIVQDGQTGWLFPPGDAMALAARIDAVLSDPVRARSVAAAARQWVVANASVDTMADRTYRVYESVLEGSAS